MNKKNIIIIVIVLFVAFIGYQQLTSSGSSVGDTSLSADTQTSDSADAKYIYSLLQQMQAVKLDDAIFNNQIFQSLKDNTVSFSSQPAGRPNPFAPIGTDVQTSASASSTQTAGSLK